MKTTSQARTRFLVIAGSGTVLFTRNLDATDITLEIEATTDLHTAFEPVATWTQAGGWTSISSVTVIETAGAVEVTAPGGICDLSERGRLFCHRVEHLRAADCCAAHKTSFES